MIYELWSLAGRNLVVTYETPEEFMTGLTAMAERNGIEYIKGLALIIEPSERICACCAEGNHISLCHNVRWATAGLERGCGCVASAKGYREAGYERQDCGHAEFYAEPKRDSK